MTTPPPRRDLLDLSELFQRQHAARDQRGAAETAGRLRQRAPKWIETWKIGAMSALDLESWALSEACAWKVLKIEPNNYAARNNLGLAVQRQSRPYEAMAHFRAAIALAPDQPRASRGLRETAALVRRFHVVKLVRLAVLVVLAQAVPVTWTTRTAVAVMIWVATLIAEKVRIVRRLGRAFKRDVRPELRELIVRERRRDRRLLDWIA